MRVALVLLAAMSLAGCARWEAQSEPGPLEFTRACPLKRAPEVTEFGASGVSGAYHFVIQDADKEDLAAFLESARTAKFNVALMTIEIDGLDTLVAQGPGVLRTQSEVDREFDAGCGIGHGKVYLTHVRYDPYDPQNAGYVRVR